MLKKTVILVAPLRRRGFFVVYTNEMHFASCDLARQFAKS